MKKIIVIEDDEVIREELQEFLKRYGYEVKAPIDFNNIIEYIENENGNLILLDINLPVFDGGLMSIFWTQKVKLFHAVLLANNSH
ncbi:DNA-binding response regulator [Clostridium fallax]|uniref:Stage 0 sporulation protein A homolog n=1 Tax=Clostridium fallax TaxID=1533 RepID=A0A1M4WZ12_9CLOT|nr:Response regulator receiver domain-containing protein [Clostridium fallax]SQB22581.1 DNA-binding response regulator [Clostridium fallax]